MPNPLATLAKPLAFGARQAFNVTQAAVHIGGAWVGAIRGGQSTHPAESPEPPAAPAPAPRHSSAQPKALDDVSITRKVETTIFRDRTVPKGKIDVNTADGVVWLRGEAKTPEMIKKLERQAAAVPEVKRVENLLHLPKTPAPTRTDTPPAQRKTQRSSRAAATRKVTPARITAERQPLADVAEPAPTELAQRREGRQAAPLGSSEGGGNGNAAAAPPKPAPPQAAPAKPKRAAKPRPAAAKPAPPTPASSGPPAPTSDPAPVRDASPPPADAPAE